MRMNFIKSIFIVCDPDEDPKTKCKSIVEETSKFKEAFGVNDYF